MILLRKSCSPALACALLVAAACAWGATAEEAARLAREGRLEAAITAYRALVEDKPRDVALRLALADALSKDRRWGDALAEYETALKLSPGNVEAMQSIGTIRRWQGHIGESAQAFERARAAAPRDSSAQLGLAATYVLDHDFSRARQLYEDAAKKWPDDGAVRRDAYDFRRQTTPRVYLYYENDLSFQTRLGGFVVPFGSREEVGYEHQQEQRFLSTTGEHTYTRTDDRALYTHTFGYKRTLETLLRYSSYSYEPAAQPTPPPPPQVFFTTAIDWFTEARVRYAHPFTPEQVASVRYTARPTTLVSGQSFVSQKIEADIESQWNPRLQTTFGTGLLHDLPSNATSASDLTNQVLWRLGAQYVITDRADVSLRYITNPDLDSTIYATTVVQAGYTLTETFSGIARWRYDDYKVDANQTAYYVGVRITPSSHLWSEFGVKYVKREPRDGFFGLASLILRF